MRLLEVYTPEIDAHVKYKVLDLDDVDDFAEANAHLKRNDYITKVLDTVVFNLRTEISGILRNITTKEGKDRGGQALESIYNGCIMLNPGLDVDRWLKLSSAADKWAVRNKMSSDDEDRLSEPPFLFDQDEEDLSLDASEPESTPKQKKIYKPEEILSRSKFLGLEPFLKQHIIGQDEAIAAVVKSLKRSTARMADPTRPLGVFLFAGSSGVGKTELAKKIHEYVFAKDFKDTSLIRIDCGEYQHKHENQKLIGSPNGYVAFEEGGQLTNQIAKYPQAVLLLDEVEKAHPDIWNTFLRAFDEGEITDNKGVVHSLRNMIIIMTTNLGNKEIVTSMTGSNMGFGGELNFDPEKTVNLPSKELITQRVKKAIDDYFRLEFLNRIDQVIVFNHLTKDSLDAIARLELEKVADKLRVSGYALDYADSVIEKMVEDGYSTTGGARGMSRVRRNDIEEALCDALLEPDELPPTGTLCSIAFFEGEYQVRFRQPRKRAKGAK